MNLNSNDFSNLKLCSNIYDMSLESNSFLKIHHDNNIMSFYQFYEHAQAYLYTRYLNKKNGSENKELEKFVVDINKIEEHIKKLSELYHKFNKISKENYSVIENMNPSINKMNEFENEINSINKWIDYLTYCNKNEKNLKINNDNLIGENLEILLKKIEVVNIAQSNLLSYVENLEYSKNLYEGKKAGLLKKYG